MRTKLDIPNSTNVYFQVLFPLLLWLSLLKLSTIEERERKSCKRGMPSKRICYPFSFLTDVSQVLLSLIVHVSSVSSDP